MNRFASPFVHAGSTMTGTSFGRNQHAPSGGVLGPSKSLQPEYVASPYAYPVRAPAMMSPTEALAQMQLTCGQWMALSQAQKYQALLRVLAGIWGVSLTEAQDRAGNYAPRAIQSVNDHCFLVSQAQQGNAFARRRTLPSGQVTDGTEEPNAMNSVLVPGVASNVLSPTRLAQLRQQALLPRRTFEDVMAFDYGAGNQGTPQDGQTPPSDTNPSTNDPAVNQERDVQTTGTSTTPSTEETMGERALRVISHPATLVVGGLAVVGLTFWGLSKAMPAPSASRKPTAKKSESKSRKKKSGQKKAA